VQPRNWQLKIPCFRVRDGSSPLRKSARRLRLTPQNESAASDRGYNYSYSFGCIRG